MKKILFLLLVYAAKVNNLLAQAPQGINYQAVAYNGTGQPVTNQTVGVRLSVLDGGANGSVLYSETQSSNTDNTGLFSIVIGNGTVVTGTFAGINWGSGTRWLKTEIDIAGGNNYVVMGSSQFMSVPYALYADKTGFSSGSFAMPDGFDNTTNVVILAGVNYTVPPGKNLYLPPTYEGVSIDGDTLYNVSMGSTKGSADARTLLGVSENSMVTSISNNITGFLVDKKVEWKTVDVALNNFAVPADKYFVIVNTVDAYRAFQNPQAGNCRVTINGTVAWVSENTILDPGTLLSTTGCTASMGAIFIVNGYFKNK